ncbi:hypothetical protein MtrunA17_Chr5g0415591 [Medicago truncatula]|uniref:Transmembrane protein n=1 Tax=Medicago truncatula TaxID=3880 RepID=A0A396HRX9_MEDTR|nr:hypothetical protein MtrunA17_Chr5g0415591 [Medicago truncatula]
MSTMILSILLPWLDRMELDFVREYLIRGKDVDVPFTPFLMKKQKVNFIRTTLDPRGNPRVVEQYLLFYGHFSLIFLFIFLFHFLLFP